MQAAQLADLYTGCEVVGFDTFGKSVCWPALDLNLFHPHLPRSVRVTAITADWARHHPIAM